MLSSSQSKTLSLDSTLFIGSLSLIYLESSSKTLNSRSTSLQPGVVNGYLQIVKTTCEKCWKMIYPGLASHPGARGGSSDSSCRFIRRKLHFPPCNFLDCVSPAQLNWKRCLRKKVWSSASLKMQNWINCEFLSFQVNQLFFVLWRKLISRGTPLMFCSFLAGFRFSSVDGNELVSHSGGGSVRINFYVLLIKVLTKIYLEPCS